MFGSECCVACLPPLFLTSATHSPTRVRACHQIEPFPTAYCRSKYATIWVAEDAAKLTLYKHKPRFLQAEATNAAAFSSFSGPAVGVGWDPSAAERTLNLVGCTAFTTQQRLAGGGYAGRSTRGMTVRQCFTAVCGRVSPAVCLSG